MQRPARTFRATFAVQFIGNGKRIGIRLENRVKSRALLIQLLNARQVSLADRPGSPAAFLHAALQIRDR